MKKFKNFIFSIMVTILSLSFLVSPYWLKNNQSHSTDAYELGKQLIDTQLSNYVTISTLGKQLADENIKSIDTNDDNKPDTSYIITNGNATINFKWQNFNFSAFFENNYFYKSTKTIQTTNFVRDPITNNISGTFEIDNQNYRYTITTVSLNEILTIYNSSNNMVVATSNVGDFITYENDNDNVTITFTTAYTLKATAPSTTFTFYAYTSGGITPSARYTLNFERPIADFKTTDVTWFTCVGLDIGNTPYSNSKLERELSYENVKLYLTNNDYTENNPLYFDINHNGFLYTFTLYSKSVETTPDNPVDFLFVEYYDTQKPSNNKSLATDLSSNPAKHVYKYIEDTDNFNEFMINFNKTGRYEISVYDSTYILGLNDCNYYSTSFYIKNDESTAFDNAYAILQTYDEEGNPLDYVVSDSTQNSDVKVTVKNLLYYFDTDTNISSFSEDNNNVIRDANGKDDSKLTLVEFVKSILTGSSNIPSSQKYSKSELEEKLSSSQDFTLFCSDDAFFEVKIYRYSHSTSLDSENNTIHTYQVIETKTYQFTIVKKPKISYSINITNEDGDQVIDPATGKPIKQIHEADTPYVIQHQDYSTNIKSKMNLTTSVLRAGEVQEAAVELSKTYVNKYYVEYAMQAVEIESVELKAEGSNNVLQQLNLKFNGIGDISVQVEYNGTTTNYSLQSGDILSFTSYGVYTVTMTDSMGTTTTDTFNYAKPVSISSLLLIGLVGVVVLVVALFIISSRGKVQTR